MMGLSDKGYSAADNFVAKVLATFSITTSR